MADLGQIGQALSGFSAGVAGQLPQFQQGLRQDRQLRQEEQESARQRFIRGVGGATQMIRSGDLMGAVQLLDSIDDPNAQRAARELLAPQTSEETALDLFNLESRAIALGDLKGPDTVSAKEQAETEKITLQSEEIRQKLASGQQPDKGDVQKQVNVLRGSLRDNLKSFRQVEEANKRINAVGKNATAASDLALIFNFMKMLDPGSVVRESEFRTAAQARAFLSKAEGQGITLPAIVVQGLQRASTGASLLPEQRVDFLNQVDDLFAAARTSADTNIENILQQADQDQIKRERVFGTKRLEAFTKRQTARQPQQRNIVVDF